MKFIFIYIFIGIITPVQSLTFNSNTNTFNYRDYVVLSCYANSYPVSALTLTKNSIPIRANISETSIEYLHSYNNNSGLSNVTYVFRRLKLSDDGDYQCIANYTYENIVLKSNIIPISKS